MHALGFAEDATSPPFPCSLVLYCNSCFSASESESGIFDARGRVNEDFWIGSGEVVNENSDEEKTVLDARPESFWISC